MTAPVELDAPPAQPPARPRLPWVLGGVAAFSLLLAIVPSPNPASARALASMRITEPVIETTQSDGWGEGTTVLRDDAGQAIAVMTAVRPFGEEGAWCRLVVDGQAVEVHSDGGHTAICVWARGQRAG